MPKIISKIGAAVLLIGLIASAGQAADRPADTEAAPQAFPAPTLIYLVSGIRDTGSAENTGVATVTHCSNWTPNSQRVRYVIKNFNGSAVANSIFTLSADATRTVSTHGTVYVEDLPFLSPGVAINQGRMAIYATHPVVTCSFQIIDAASGSPNGGDLHVVRVNPIPNTQE
jgi:hypothetical protein